MPSILNLAVLAAAVQAVYAAEAYGAPADVDVNLGGKAPAPYGAPAHKDEQPEYEHRNGKTYTTVSTTVPFGAVLGGPSSTFTSLPSAFGGKKPVFYGTTETPAYPTYPAKTTHDAEYPSTSCDEDYPAKETYPPKSKDHDYPSKSKSWDHDYPSKSWEHEAPKTKEWEHEYPSKSWEHEAPKSTPYSPVTKSWEAPKYPKETKSWEVPKYHKPGNWSKPTETLYSPVTKSWEAPKYPKETPTWEAPKAKTVYETVTITASCEVCGPTEPAKPEYPSSSWSPEIPSETPKVPVYPSPEAPKVYPSSSSWSPEKPAYTKPAEGYPTKSAPTGGYATPTGGWESKSTYYVTPVPATDVPHYGGYPSGTGAYGPKPTGWYGNNTKPGYGGPEKYTAAASMNSFSALAMAIAGMAIFIIV